MIAAWKLFNAPNFNEIGDCAYWTVNRPGSPVSLVFDSNNRTVVGNDGYYGDSEQRQLKQLWFYEDPVLLGNYPNPVIEETAIAYDLSAAAEVSLALYEVGGRLVRWLEPTGWKAASRHETAWDVKDRFGRVVKAGVYVCRLDVNGAGHFRKLIVVR